MTFGTHIAFASVLYLGGATLFGYKPDWIGWLLAAVASLGPDVDLPASKIGRLFFWLSVPLERRFGHRTITHSVIGMMTVAVIASPLWLVRPFYFGCVLGGYWSHIWIDMLNIRGADLLWPHARERYPPLPASLQSGTPSGHRNSKLSHYRLIGITTQKSINDFK